MKVFKDVDYLLANKNSTLVRNQNIDLQEEIKMIKKKYIVYYANEIADAKTSLQLSCQFLQI